MICAAWRWALAWARWLIDQYDAALTEALQGDRAVDIPDGAPHVDPYLAEADIVRDAETVIREARR